MCTSFPVFHFCKQCFTLQTQLLGHRYKGLLKADVEEQWVLRFSVSMGTGHLPSMGIGIIDMPITVLRHPFPPTLSALDHKEKIASLMNEKWCLIGFFLAFPRLPERLFLFISSSFPAFNFFLRKHCYFCNTKKSSLLLLFLLLWLLLKQAQAHRRGLWVLIGPPEVKCPFLSPPVLGDRRTYNCRKVGGIPLTGFRTAPGAGDWVNPTVLMTTAG